MKIVSGLTAVILSAVTSLHAAPRYHSDVVISERVEPDSSLVEFIQSLRDALQEKNFQLIADAVDPDFYYIQDYAGALDPEKDAVKNFTDILLLPKSDFSDQALLARYSPLNNLLKARVFQQRDGDTCAPANAEPVNPNRPDEFWLSWAYIDGEGVNLRAKPSDQSKIIQQLSYEVVEPIQSQMGQSNSAWIKVVTSAAKQGFVNESFVQPFKKAQICYQQKEGQWQIVGFVGGREP